jgi:hypothetical protein
MATFQNGIIAAVDMSEMLKKGFWKRAFMWHGFRMKRCVGHA